MSSEQGVYLDDYLKQKGPIQYSRVSRIAVAILKQLDRRVRTGVGSPITIVHPGRIRITGGSVELVDAAELATDAFLDDTLAPYISPEELRQEKLDVRATLYSLGCSLHELLTGQTPFPGNDPDTIRNAHLVTPVPDPRELNPDIPSSMSELVQRLLAKDPRERPSGPAAVAAEFQASLGIGPPVARPAAPGASRRAPATSPRPATVRGRTVRAAPGRSRRKVHDHIREEDANPSGSHYAPRNPAPVFSYAGAVVGVLISILFLVRAMQLKNEQPTRDRETRRVETVAAVKRIQKRREDENPLTQFVQAETEAARQLTAKLNLQLSTQMKKDVIEQTIARYYYTPSGRRMAEEWLRLHYLADENNRGHRPGKKQQ